MDVHSVQGKKTRRHHLRRHLNLGDNPLYRQTPMEVLIREKPDVMLNLSASPYNYAQDTVRNSIVKAHTEKYNIPMLYCNTVGSQTEIVFDGGSLVYDAQGNRVKEMTYFEADYFLYELPAPTPPMGGGANTQGQQKHEAPINMETSLGENNTAEKILQTDSANERNASLQGETSQPGPSPLGVQGDGLAGRAAYYYSAADVGKGSDIIAYL